MEATDTRLRIMNEDNQVVINAVKASLEEDKTN